MDCKCLGYRGLETVVVIREEVIRMMISEWFCPRATAVALTMGYWWGWCCLSIYLVWMDYKGLGYRGLETVVVTREEVNMMIRGYRYLVYRGVVNVIDKAGGECDGGW
jgi:hypothetical protein